MSDLEPLPRLEVQDLRFLTVFAGYSPVGDPQVVVRFGNGYGASVIENYHTNAGPTGLFEVLPVVFEGEGPTWHAVDDVTQSLNSYEAADLLRDLAALPGALR